MDHNAVSSQGLSSLSSSFWGIYIALVILIPFAFEMLVEMLDLRYKAPELPEELKDIYSEIEAEKSRAYHLDRLKPGMIQSSLSLLATVLMFSFGGFGAIDQWSRSFFPSNTILAGLSFIAIISLGSSILSLPFNIYSTFVIEEKYGFNRSTPMVFIMDLFKGAALGIVIGGPILAGLIWIFEWASSYSLAWALVWGLMTLISVTLLFISPLLMGLFNKYTPLEDGELKSSIENLAQNLSFEIQGIYKMDGSKRSSKANAFFAGFGSFRRIALFDTLIEKLDTKEICAVLGHEIGHCKHKHIFKQFFLNSISMGLSFFLVQELMFSAGLYEVFQVTPSTGVGLFIIFGFVLSPFHVITGLLSNVFSRKYEFEADTYAAQHAHGTDDLISSLKKLSQDSLSQLQPHPLKAFVEHSHPTLIERTQHLRAIQGKA